MGNNSKNKKPSNQSQSEIRTWPLYEISPTPPWGGNLNQILTEKMREYLDDSELDQWMGELETSLLEEACATVFRAAQKYDSADLAAAAECIQKFTESLKSSKPPE